MELRGFPERVAAFRRGDRDALTALYQAHRQAVERLLRYGFTFTSHGRTMRFRGYDEPYALQEATQDAFLHAFRVKARESYDETQPFAPFLLTLARNRVLDQLRRARLESRYMVPLSHLEGGPDEAARVSADPLQQAPQPSPERQAQSAQLQRALQQFFETLDEADDAVLRLHLIGDMSQEQIAARLGEDRNAIRKRVRELRGGLLRHLKASGFIADLQITELLTRGLILGGVMR